MGDPLRPEAPVVGQRAAAVATAIRHQAAAVFRRLSRHAGRDAGHHPVAGLMQVRMDARLKTGLISRRADDLFLSVWILRVSVSPW